MGFFDKLAEKAKNFDYESARASIEKTVENKQKSIERNARNQIRQKVRNASDDALRRNLQNAIDNDNYIMEEEIKKEMDRRGLYY